MSAQAKGERFTRGAGNVEKICACKEPTRILWVWAPRSATREPVVRCVWRIVFELRFVFDPGESLEEGIYEQLEPASDEKKISAVALYDYQAGTPTYRSFLVSDSMALLRRRRVEMEGQLFRTRWTDQSKTRLRQPSFVRNNRNGRRTLCRRT